MKELLTAVSRVCDGQTAALSQMAHRVDAFLFDERSLWTLESASKRGFFRLLDRLLTQEWPGFNRSCREQRLKSAVALAARQSYEVRVQEWWLRRYVPGQQVVSITDVLEFAIMHGNIPLLEWLNEETESDLPLLEIVAHCSDPDTMIWLYQRGHHSNARLLLPHFWKSDVDIDSIKRCLAYEDKDSSFKIWNPESAVDYAIAHGQLAFLQWLHEHRPTVFKHESHLNLAIRFGRLDMAKWMQETFPEHYFDDPDSTFTDPLPYIYDFDMIQWAICELDWANDQAYRTWTNDAMMFAAGAGKLETLEVLHKINMEVFKNTQDDCRKPELIDAAAANGHLAIVQWLQDHQQGSCTTRAMDDAAANSHLNVVQWLHANRFEGCTAFAMDISAAFGHMEVVQWLHDNRSEGCTTNAMDKAAANGHLHVIEWLHQNRIEGCTTTALDLAATNGHLKIMQWLHENRTEGCTTHAMDFPAQNGHLDVVQYLHANRREGCTAYAKEYTAAMGHFDTFRWLQENRAEPFKPDMGRWCRKNGDANRRSAVWHVVQAVIILKSWWTS